MDAPMQVVPSVETTTDKHEDDEQPKAALTPPTSEDMDKRGARLSSELSELQSDDEEEEIEPDHYFDGGKIPVFKPTMDQFRSFKKFIDKVDKYGMKSGIVKVIPPKEWRDSLPDLSEAVKSIKVKNPITQEFAGQHGIYTQANIEKQRSYNLPEWRSLTDEPHHQPPAKRGERRKAAESLSRTRSTRAQASLQVNDDSSPGPRRGPGRPKKRQIKAEEKDDEEDAEENVEKPPTPKSPGPSKEEVKRPSRTRVKREGQDEPIQKARGRQPKSTASRRMNNRSAVNDYVDEEAFKDFNYHLPGLDEFSVGRCKELEENYWRTINFGQPMYGADMPGSLFDERTTSWNVAKLENILDVLGTKVPGVNTAYLYLGMWKATFAWHLEDVDLYSINYIHFGAPKQWYSISQEDARRFEAAMKSIWPRDAKNCSQFLRHKTYLISPAQLEKQFNIKVNRLVHYEGEFVITYPYGYHSGYNLGYNCAESVNFANEAWLSYGRIAKKCECESDSVWVDVNEIERKLRGEPTPEYYEETDDEDDEDIPDHLPSPPRSVAGKAKSKAGRKPNSKRKRANEEPKEALRPKKIRRIRIRIKVPGRGMPCVLCPNDVEFDELLPTDNGLKAHRLCADYTPETYIASKPNEVVCNVANIGKDRLDLKCNYCRSKRGAVFQCSQKKCTRAFHATCAAAAGVQVDLGPMPTFDEEGTEYFYDGYDFRCRFHRPKKRNLKKVTSDSLENDKMIMTYAKNLKSKDVVQFQYLETELYQIYGGLVIENRPGESTVLVEVLPDGDRIEVEWKYLLLLDPIDSERPKPSANAKPLPEHLKETDSSLAITNRTDGVPEIGDPFHDPNAEQKWQEFNTAPEVRQKIAKVDFSKPDKLWYYLGKTSTEARPQYTENIAQQRHNTDSNFLDTVKPPSLPLPQMIRHPYSASYPIKPGPASIPPRTPTQQQLRPAEKPYQYKPRPDPPYRTPAVYNYSPDTRKNPNSPVAHQPNVVYDHRTAPPHQNYGTSPTNTNPYHHNHRSSQSHTFHHYTPPVPAPTSPNSSWKAHSTPGPQQWAQSSHILPPYPYYTPSTNPPRTGPSSSSSSYPRKQVLDQQAVPSSSSAPALQSTAPMATILTKPLDQYQSPMYAAPSFAPTQTFLSQSEYISYVTKYPYLKNAFLRRAKTYISPYSPNGGFNPDWISKASSALVPQASSSSSQPNPGLGVGFGAVPVSLPPQRPVPQFQSADAFQRDISNVGTTHSGYGKFESMIKRMSASGKSQTAKPAASFNPTQVPQGVDIPSPRPTVISNEAETSCTPAESSPVQRSTLPLLSPSEPQRRTPSPPRPEYSPISDDGMGVTVIPAPTPAPIHSGETWRYS